MKVAYAMIVFLLCLSIGQYIANGLQVLPNTSSPYFSPQTIASNFLEPISLAAVGIGVVIGLLARNPYITVASLIVFGMEKMLRFGGWGIATFPAYLESLGVPLLLTSPLQLLFYFVWFWAVMEFLTGRMSVG